MKHRYEADDDEPAPFIKFKRQTWLGNDRDRPGQVSSGCKGKMKFISAPAAIKALKHKSNIDGRRAYRCPVCYQWHIGSTTRTTPK